MVDLPNPIDVALGAEMLRLRECRGMSQADLARALGVSVRRLTRYEAGRARIPASTLMSVTRALGVSIADFLDTLRPTACH